MGSQPRVIGMVAACPYPSSQGSQVLIRQIARGLAGRGHRVHVFTYPFGVPGLPPDPEIRLHRARAPIRSRRLDPGPSAAKPLLDAALLLRVVSVARREGIEILHGHNYEGQAIARAAGFLLGIPAVYHAHTLLADELPTYVRGDPWRALLRRLGATVDRHTARAAHHVFAVSPDIVARVRDCGVPAGRVSLLPPGVVRAEWPDRPARRASSGPCPDGDGGGPRLIYTGNLAAFQNIPELLESVRRLRLSVPSARLALVTPSDPAGIADRIRTLDLGEAVEVIVEHRFSRIVPRLLRADIACSTRTMPSGFPIKQIAYMAAGLPTVAFEGGAKGVVNGETGLVVPDHDVAAHATALEALSRDSARRRRMGDRAREVAFREFDADTLAERLEQTCETLIGDRLRRRHGARGGG